MIAMRDGVKLHTVVFTPKERRAPLPVLFVRTPYGVPADERAAAGSYEFLIEDGYILAFQDIRGRFKSEGAFVMQRPPRNRQDRSAIDESTDAYDSIDWMTKNVRGNNGRVGMLALAGLPPPLCRSSSADTTRRTMVGCGTIITRSE